MQKYYSIIRTSTTVQARDSKSGPQAQREQIARYCEKHSIPITGEISDLGISAGKLAQFKSGNLGKKISELRRNKFEPDEHTLIFAYHSRFSRAEANDAVQKFSELLQQGFGIIFAEDEHHIKASNPENYFRDLILVLIGLQESNKYLKNLQRQTSDAWRIWREKWIDFNSGKRKQRPSNNLMNKTRWWQKFDENNVIDEKKQLINDPEKTPLVREIFDLFTEQNKSQREIAKILNEKNIPRQSNYKRKEKYEDRGQYAPLAVWIPSAIKEVLINRLVINEKQVSQQIKDEDGKRIAKPILIEGKPLILKNFIEGKPIISKTQFLKAQSLLEKNPLHRGKKSKKVNIFRGICIDGYFNLPMSITINARGDGIQSLRPTANKIYGVNKSKNLSLKHFECAFFTSYNLIKNHAEISKFWNYGDDERQANLDEEISELKLEINEQEKQSSSLIDQVANATNKKLADKLTAKADEVENTIEANQNRLEILERQSSNKSSNILDEDLENLRRFSTDIKLREKAHNFLYSTNHKIFVFSGGIKFEKQKLLKKFGEIHSDLGDEKNWNNFDHATFKKSPFYFLNQYIFFKLFYSSINKSAILEALNDTEFGINIFHEFFGKPIELPKFNEQRIFICQLDDGRQFSATYSPIVRGMPKMISTSIGRGFNVIKHPDEFDFERPNAFQLMPLAKQLRFNAKMKSNNFEEIKSLADKFFASNADFHENSIYNVLSDPVHNKNVSSDFWNVDRAFYLTTHLPPLLDVPNFKNFISKAI